MNQTKRTTQNQSDHQKIYQQNCKNIRMKLNQNEHRLIDCLDFLIKEYPPFSDKINLGSMYQYPIHAKGIKLLLQYFIWDIQILNLSMHNIADEGLQLMIQEDNYLNENCLKRNENCLKRNENCLKRNENQQTNQGILSTNPQCQQLKSRWKNLTQLSIIKNNITSEGFKGIQDVNLKNFKVLRANNNKIDRVAMLNLIKCDWVNFQQLYIGNNKIGKEGCKILMRSEWNNFKRLDLNYNLIGNEGVYYLSQANWPQLLQINLSNNKLDCEATIYLKNSNWPQLKILILNRNRIGMLKGKLTEIGVANICQIKSKYIDRLFLYGNQLTLNAITIIITSKHFTPNCFLELSRNHFRFQEIRELLRSQDKFCNQFDD